MGGKCIEIINAAGRRVIVPLHIWENGMNKGRNWKVYVSPPPVGPPVSEAKVLKLTIPATPSQPIAPAAPMAEKPKPGPKPKAKKK